MADSDSTDGLRKIRVAQASQDSDVAVFVTGLESVDPITCLHRLFILHRTAPLRMDTAFRVAVIPRLIA